MLQNDSVTKWLEVARPTKGGHRYFVRSNGKGIAIADNSGYTPSSTDDGPLWLDFHRSIVLDTMDGKPGRVLASLPVTEVYGKRGEFWVSVPVADLVWLLSEGFVRPSEVEARGEAKTLLDLAQELKRTPDPHNRNFLFR